MHPEFITTGNGMIHLIDQTKRQQLEKAQRGIQSIEVGGELLRVLVHTQRPMALRDLVWPSRTPPLALMNSDLSRCSSASCRYSVSIRFAKQGPRQLSWPNGLVTPCSSRCAVSLDQRWSAWKSPVSRYTSICVPAM